MESIIFLIEKRDGTMKARMCANGSNQRNCVPKEKASIPTVTSELVLITSTIDAQQERDTIPMDIRNAFGQTKVPQDDKRTIMNV